MQAGDKNQSKNGKKPRVHDAARPFHQMQKNKNFGPKNTNLTKSSGEKKMKISGEVLQVSETDCH